MRPLEIDPRTRATNKRPDCRFPSQQTIVNRTYPLILPVYLYGSLQYGPTPKVYAATTVLFAASLLLIAVAAILLRVVGRRSGGGTLRALVPGRAS